MSIINKFSVDDILKLLPLLLDKNIENYKILGKLSINKIINLFYYPVNLEAFEYLIKEDLKYIEYFTYREEIKVESSANINDDEDEFKNTLNDLGFLVYDQIASLADPSPSNKKDNKENTLNKSSKEIIKKQPENSLDNKKESLADILWLFLSNFPSFEILNKFNKFLNYDAKDINVLENSNDNANIKMSELRLDILKNYIKKLKSTPLENLQRDNLKKIFTDFKVKLIEESGILNCFINKNNSKAESELLQLLYSKSEYYLYKQISESNIFKNYSENNEDRLKLIEFLTKNFLSTCILELKHSFKTFKDYEIIVNIREASGYSLKFKSLFKDIDWSNQDHLNLMRNILIEKEYLQLENDINLDEITSSILNALSKLDKEQIKGVVSDIQAKLEKENIDLNKKEENTKPVTETTEENKQTNKTTKPLTEKTRKNKQPNEEKKGLFINIIYSIYSFIKAIAQAIIDFIKFFIPNSILESSTVSTKNTEKSK